MKVVGSHEVGHINDDGASEVVGNGLGEEDQGEGRDEHSEGCAQKQEVCEAIRSVHRIEWLTTSARGEEAGSQATQEGTSVHESPRLAVVWEGRGGQRVELTPAVARPVRTSSPCSCMAQRGIGPGACTQSLYARSGVRNPKKLESRPCP